MKRLFLILIIIYSQVCLLAEKENYQPGKYQRKKQIRYVVKHYFKQRYQSLQELKLLDFSYQIAYWIAETRNWAKDETALREIILRQAEIYDLGYVEYDFQLKIQSIRYLHDGKKAVVNLLESHQVVFESTKPIISELANRAHLISLRLRNGIWHISYDQYDHEYEQMLVDFGQQQVIKKIQQNFVDISNEEAPFKEPERYPEQYNFQPYDRAAAVKYANRYWKNYHTDFGDFENNNCTNYVSQILLAGGAPMDFEGNMQWYYENPQTPGDSYTYSWAVAQDLYYYLIKNSWTGPIGRKATICEIEPGDIIQFYSPSKGWVHSVVVVQNLKKWSCGNQLNYLINSHTSDRRNYPLAYFSALPKRFIQVVGWFH